MRVVLLLILSVFFVACSIKVPSIAINSTAFDANGDLKEKSFYTYNKEETKITGYFFSKDSTSSNLKYTHMIVYVPIDYTGQLYDDFSNVTWALRRYTNGTAKTLEEAFENSIEQKGSKNLFKAKKEEFLVDAKLARNLIREIEEFERKIQRQEDGDNEEIIIIP